MPYCWRFRTKWEHCISRHDCSLKIMFIAPTNRTPTVTVKYWSEWIMDPCLVRQLLLDALDRLVKRRFSVSLKYHFMLSGPESAGGEGESSPGQSRLYCGPPGRPGQSVRTLLHVLICVEHRLLKHTMHVYLSANNDKVCHESSNAIKTLNANAITAEIRAKQDTVHDAQHTHFTRNQ